MSKRSGNFGRSFASHAKKDAERVKQRAAGEAIGRTVQSWKPLAPPGRTFVDGEGREVVALPAPAEKVREIFVGKTFHVDVPTHLVNFG